VASAPCCPICRAPVTWDDNPDRPFCSERCRLIDLGGWVSERYRIPGADTPGGVADADDGADGDSGENGAA